MDGEKDAVARELQPQRGPVKRRIIQWGKEKKTKTLAYFYQVDVRTY